MQELPGEAAGYTFVNGGNTYSVPVYLKYGWVQLRHFYRSLKQAGKCDKVNAKINWNLTNRVYLL